ncbi:bacterial transcriptional activator domain-containing protein [Micromonospora sp. NPDC048999]|uniref:AfsR/SARP family transcriptional regulator n=1 Tax=Micromonospora sp. NPDC048999 TaxID=3155391 RepID=UPI0033FC139A
MATATYPSAHLNSRAFEKAADGNIEVIREQGGYRLSGAPDTVDLNRLTARLSEARATSEAESPAEAVPLLADVVEGWHGSLLAGLPLGPALAARREAAERKCEEAFELLADLHLRVGRPDLAVGLLRPYAARRYAREHVQVLLMQALIATDDPAGRSLLESRRRIAERRGTAPAPMKPARIGHPGDRRHGRLR